MTLACIDHLADTGALVATRQHIPGPGDILAIWPGPVIWLVEVQMTTGGPWRHLGPRDRLALHEHATRVGADAIIAYRPNGIAWSWLGPEKWPERLRRARYPRALAR